MKLAFSTNAFVRFSLESAIDKIADIGYSAVEILADKPHAFFPLNKRQQNNINNLISKRGLTVSSINVNTAAGYFTDGDNNDPFEPSLSSRDEKYRRWRIDYTKYAIDFASAINAKNISITSGNPATGTTREEQIRRFIESLNEIVEYASLRNIDVGIEYEPGLLIENADQTLYIIRKVNNKHLGVNLDIGHCHVLDEDKSLIIRLFREKIFNVHLYDIKDRKHYHLIPGEGDIDFACVIDSLNNVRYDRYITIELYTYAAQPEHAARKALSYLKQIEVHT